MAGYGLLVDMRNDMYRWVLDDVLSLQYSVRSPSFVFVNVPFHLKLEVFPQDDRLQLSIHTEIPSDACFQVSFEMGTGFGGELENRSGRMDKNYFSIRRWMPWSELLKRRLEILQNGCLDVKIKLQKEEKAFDQVNLSSRLLEMDLWAENLSKDSSEDSDDEESAVLPKNAERTIQDYFDSVEVDKTSENDGCAEKHKEVSSEDSYDEESAVLPKNLFNFIISICKDYEKDGMFVFWAYWPFVIVFHEKYFKALANEPTALHKPGLYDIVEELSGRGLLTNKGDTWKTHRKLLNPAFRFNILKSYVSAFNEGAHIIVKDFEKVCSRPTTEVIDILKTGSLRILFGTILEMNLNKGNYNSIFNRYLKLLSSLEDHTIFRFSRPWYHFKYFQLLFKTGREYRHLYKEFHSIIRDIVLELKDKIASEDSRTSTVECSSIKKSFARILLENHLKDPSFTFEEVVGDVSTFIFAGHDTTSHTMLWTLFLLGHHSQVQERVFEEIESVINSETDTISYSDLSKLEYLEAVIKESLRIYPVVPFYGRQNNKEIQLGEHCIPKDAIIVFSQFLLHRNPAHFPCPEKFNPERFYRNSLDSPWSFSSFSEGIRSCIGKTFALMEMKIVLAQLIWHFQITTLTPRDVTLEWSVTLSPAEPIEFSVIRRQNYSLPQG